MAPIPDTTMERLAFVRYAYHQGVEQSRAPEPGNSVGVLLFHDAVDLFLQLAAEHLNMAKKPGKASLLDYLAEIDAHLQPATLSGRQGMVRLNSIRNSLKHNGVRPSSNDVEGLRGSVTSFLEDNTPILFGLQLHEISMARLVSVEKARDHLLEAEKLLASGDHVAAIEACALAFYYVVRAYHRLNPPAFKKAAFGPRAGSGADANLRQLVEYVGEIATALDELQGRVDLLTLEVDPPDAARFTRTTPRVVFTMDGKSHLTWLVDTGALTDADARFCYSTVIGAALAFQRRFAV